ncbi:ABC transporter ATP-binding protein [Billgrantia montanilacus]|uniref:ABC transporter ATP-binding protein n=1 Tax=Billgrantia montanilacus TaxID=2282305 RepID=A0A368U4E2_9GAMM|nr:ABC transporter ATP-binding protein [Halomonas montanilacus]RCV91337.1 ABC transporter ATP-binding protein [Halomonas montanilacus]
MAQITLKALAHSYSTSPDGPQDYAIREMDHVWHQGGAYALLGPSGCGKSTLLNIISGLLTPSEGQVLFDDQVMNELPPEERNIAQVFQFPVVYDTMTVFDNLAFPLRNIGTPAEKVKQRVGEVADILDLTSLLKRKAKNLTADEKQKVSMGRGLVRDDVSAILFDEPLTVIDPQLKWKLRRKLKEIHEKFNITMIYVTHDQLEASTFADKIAVMYDGQVVQFGTPRELFEMPAHTFVGYFIGSPGMNFLDVELTKTGVLVNGVSLPLSQRFQMAMRRAGSRNLKIGIRPEFVEVLPKPSDDTCMVEVKNTQDFGTYRILSFQFAGQNLKARIDEGQVVSGDRAHVRFPDTYLNLYVDEYRVEVGDE